MITIAVFSVIIAIINSICAVLAYRMYKKQVNSKSDLFDFIADNFHYFAIILILILVLYLVIHENCKIEVEKIYTLKVTCFKLDGAEYSRKVKVTEFEYNSLTKKSRYSKNGINLLDGKTIPIRNVKEFEVVK
jgi:hypothetical protein